MTGKDTTQWEPEGYAANARFVSDLGRPVVDLLAPRVGERVLDLGCGDGALTVALRDLGCEVVAVDASPAMVEGARARGLDARVMDGQQLEFDRAFDAVFTNAALHWMADPDAVLAGVARALVPGGRFVGEFGGAGNVASITQAITGYLREQGHQAMDPWYFPTAGDFTHRLDAAGFAVEHMTVFPRPTTLPGGLRGWLDTFGHACFEALSTKEREHALDAIEDRLRAQLCDAAGRWTLDYVRLRFAARLATR